MCAGLIGGMAGPFAAGSAIQYDSSDPNRLAKAQLQVMEANALANFSQHFYGDTNPKRRTRAKWWLVRKAIPLPWARR